MNDPVSTSKSGALFREHAIEQVAARQYGTVLLTHPHSHTALTIWFAALIAMLVGFLMTFDITRKAQSQGVLMPSAGALRVVALQAGRIRAAEVKDGQQVRAGDVLFILSNERSSANVEATQEAVTSLLARRRQSFELELKQSRDQARQRLADSREKAAVLLSESKNVEEQQRLQQERVTLAERSLKRYADLMAANYISAAQMQDKQAELLDQRQRLADIQRLQVAAKRNVLDLQANIRDLEIQANRDAEALMRNTTALTQDIVENEARREVVIRAPVDGKVTAIAAVAGQTLPSGAPLATILPADSPLEAELYVPSRAIGFIKPGMKVLLRYQAYPYQKFGQHSATVSEVASAALMPQEFNAPGIERQSSEPMYRVRLKLDRQTVQAYGQHVPLKTGMLFDGSVVLEHRKLFEWVLEPLFSISGRF